VSLELQNHSRHDVRELETIVNAVTSHTSLVAALDFARHVTGAPAIPTVVTQDEYTHDVTLRLGDDLYLTYGMT
jgi:hypothetical protein